MAKLTVHVQDIEGSPISWATVTVDGGGKATNAAGNAVFYNKTVGQGYRLRVDKKDYYGHDSHFTITKTEHYEEVTLEAIPVPPSAERIYVGPAELTPYEPPEPPPPPPPASPTLVFHVVTESLYPIAGALVSIFAGAKLTDFNGTVTFRNMPEGQEVEYFVRKRGYITIHSSTHIGTGAIVHEKTVILERDPTPPPPLIDIELPRPSSFMPDWTWKDWAIICGAFGAYFLFRDELRGDKK